MLFLIFCCHFLDFQHSGRNLSVRTPIYSDSFIYRNQSNQHQSQTSNAPPRGSAYFNVISKVSRGFFQFAKISIRIRMFFAPVCYFDKNNGKVISIRLTIYNFYAVYWAYWIMKHSHVVKIISLKLIGHLLSVVGLSCSDSIISNLIIAN